MHDLEFANWVDFYHVHALAMHAKRADAQCKQEPIATKEKTELVKNQTKTHLETVAIVLWLM
jgi:hypothetical protein